MGITISVVMAEEVYYKSNPTWTNKRGSPRIAESTKCQ